MARLSDGVAGGTRNAGAITASPTAKLTYDQPQIATMSGATGNWTPAVGSNPAPISVPSYQQQYPSAAQSPANIAAPAPAPAAPAAPPPPAPPVGGKTWYSGLDQGARAAQDQSWLGGDSDYTAQISEYDKALQSFIDRIAGQKKMYNQDAEDALSSTGRNQTMSLDNLGEDFGARGLSYSGLFDQTKNQTNDRFNEAKGGIEKVRARNLTDASNRQSDYESENQISRGNAERASLARQAQRQALLDSMAGF